MVIAGEEEQEEEGEEEEEWGKGMGRRVGWGEVFTLGTPCHSRVLGASHRWPLASLALIGAVIGQ